MKEHFQTWETDRGVTVTSVTLYDGKNVGRGVSVCSLDDEPDEVDGSVKAYAYAEYALKGKKRVVPMVRRYVKRTVAESGCPWVNHSEFNPFHMSFAEKRSLFGKKMRPKVPLVVLKESAMTRIFHDLQVAGR